MARYVVKGYTGPVADFTATIDFGGDLLSAFVDYDRRYTETWAALKDALLQTDCPSDYLEVFDYCDFEVREDLAEYDGQQVLLAASYGCDNCQKRDGDGDGNNEWTDGCDDEPHGYFLLTFDRVS